MHAALSREQVRRVDRLAIDRYGISGLVLMENAGRNAAATIRELYGETGNALICCGPGNNGGDGCVIARHLHNAGWVVRLMIAGDESRLTEDAEANYRIVQAMGLDLRVTSDRVVQQTFVKSVDPTEVLIDALLGTGFQGEVRSSTAELIHTINEVSKRATVAIDVPSGLDCDTGRPSNATVRADVTITFVAGKRGFSSTAAVPYVGQVEVADIGAPRELVAEIAAGRP